MRSLLTLLLLTISMVAAAADHTDLTADKLVRSGTVLQGSGHARATLGNLTIAADDANLHSDTGELEMRGHVHATLPAREDHTLFRYGSGTLLTLETVGVTADRLTIKDGLLRAWGNIAVVPVDPELPGVQLHGDEMFMYLRIADATLRGNVRTVRIPESSPSNRFARRPVFPPDIIK